MSRSGNGGADSGAVLALRLCNGGDVEQDGGAATQLAFRLDPAPMGLDEVLDDRQTESRASFLARAPRVNAVEALENARQVVGRYSRPGVRDPDEDVIAGALGLHS